MPGTGSLVVKVYTSKAVIPIPDASVAVTQNTGAGQTLIGLRYTDRSGITEPVLIQTPDLEESLHPSSETPYSLCDIFVIAPGYQSFTIHNVQIFPNARAVQNVMLVPQVLGDGPANGGITVSVTPQDL